MQYSSQALCDMFNAAMAGCSRCRVAWEAVLRLHVDLQEDLGKSTESAKVFWRVVLRRS